MIKKWLMLVVLIGASGWLTWKLLVIANPADITMFGFIFGPALFLFCLGAAFGAAAFQRPPLETAGLSEAEEWPQPIREARSAVRPVASRIRSRPQRDGRRLYQRPPEEWPQPVREVRPAARSASRVRQRPPQGARQ